MLIRRWTALIGFFLCSAVSPLVLPSSNDLFQNGTSNSTIDPVILQHTNLSSEINESSGCVDLTNPFEKRAKYTDCKFAIRQLPEYDEMGAFHNTGPTDPFKLPVIKTSSSCTVEVELRAGSGTTRGMWKEISDLAFEVNRDCLRTILPLYKGAWVTYGRQERIVISLSPSASSNEGNGSANF